MKCKGQQANLLPVLLSVLGREAQGHRLSNSKGCICKDYIQPVEKEEIVLVSAIFFSGPAEHQALCLALM